MSVHRMIALQAAVIALGLILSTASLAADAVVVASTQPGLTPGQVIDGAKTLHIDAGKTVSLISETGKAIDLTGPFEGAPAPGSGVGGDRSVFQSLARAFGGGDRQNTALGTVRGIKVEVKASESANAPVADTVQLYGSSHALVIGIDRYTKGWPRLSKAVEDARVVAKELERQGFEVTLEPDLGADALRTTLREFFAIKGADPNARLLFWYAGHGHSIGGEGFLVPADAPADTSPAFLVSALPMRDFGSLVRLARSKHVLSIFDSCFSGTIFQARAGAASRAITRKTTKPVRQFITSGDAGQQVRDDGSFREYFLRALRGEEKADFNDDGYVTGEELGLFLNQQITALTSDAQTPKTGKLHDVKFNQGDFVFVLPGAGSTEKTGGGAPSAGPSAEVVFWQSIQASTNPADFDAYLRQFPTGTFAMLAKNRLAALTRVATVHPAPVRPPAPATPAVGVYRKLPEPVEYFKDCAECPKMVEIPPGRFRMGDLNGSGDDDEKPVHEVRIDYSFAVGLHEVTQAEWQAVMGNNPSYFAGIRKPVERVSWDDAQEFARRLSDKTGENYRLLSESEWEYVARAGTTSEYSFGNSEDDLCAYANAADLTAKEADPSFTTSNCRDRHGKTTSSVGSYLPNAFGLHDLHGNVMEWVGDCWHDHYNGAPTDGSAWSSDRCSERVLRGGSWLNAPKIIRSAFRFSYAANGRYNNIGFRVARALAQ